MSYELNRAARRSTAGRHRKVQRQTAVAAAAAAAVTVSLALAPMAGAAPSQGGTTGGTQGGTTSSPAPTPAPAPQAAPVAPAEPIYWGPPPAVQKPYVPKPNYNYGTGQSTPAPYVAPAAPSFTPGTTYEPAPMYIAPEQTVMIGDIHFKQANWMTDEDVERTNNTAELIRSDVSDLWRSTGMEPERADRVAAGQVTGTVIGAAGGCLALATPAALIGGTIGGNVGLGLGNVIIPVVGSVPGGLAGTAIGAAGAAAPACLVGGAIGGGAGFIAGTAFGAGDEDGTPIEIEVPDVDEPAITETVETTLTGWEQSGPVGQSAATAVRDVVTTTAPAIDTQVRDWVGAQPGGEQIIDNVDAALGEFFGGSAGTASEMISTAFGQGAGAPVDA